MSFCIAVINEICISPVKQKRREFRQFAKSAFRCLDAAYLYAVCRNFSKKAFSEQLKSCTKAQKTSPTKFVTIVGLKLMPIRMAGIAFFRVAWYDFDENM